jgi:hypothetical protein
MRKLLIILERALRGMAQSAEGQALSPQVQDYNPVGAFANGRLVVNAKSAGGFQATMTTILILLLSMLHPGKARGQWEVQRPRLPGTGTAAVVSLSLVSVAFGNQSVATTSAAQSLTLTNTGNATLTITSLAVTGTNARAFAQTNNCGSSVAAGANCTISVTFMPTAAGTRSGTLAAAQK